MPAVIPFIPLIAAGIAGGAAVGGAKMQSNAIRRSTETQTRAETEAARIQDDAAKRAEAFEREQQQGTWRDAEMTRKANYDQWAARQRSLNAFRKQHGYTEMDVPGYVASEDPRFVVPPDAPPPAERPPEGYTGPAADSWRTPGRIARPRGTGGAVGDYLDAQPMPYARSGTVDEYLRPRRR